MACTLVDWEVSHRRDEVSFGLEVRPGLCGVSVASLVLVWRWAEALGAMLQRRMDCWAYQVKDGRVGWALVDSCALGVLCHLFANGLQAWQISAILRWRAWRVGLQTPALCAPGPGETAKGLDFCAGRFVDLRMRAMSAQTKGGHGQKRNLPEPIWA